MLHLDTDISDKCNTNLKGTELRSGSTLVPVQTLVRPFMACTRVWTDTRVDFFFFFYLHLFIQDYSSNITVWSPSVLLHENVYIAEHGNILLTSNTRIIVTYIHNNINGPHGSTYIMVDEMVWVKSSYLIYIHIIGITKTYHNLFIGCHYHIS